MWGVDKLAGRMWASELCIILGEVLLEASYLAPVGVRVAWCSEQHRQANDSTACACMGAFCVILSGVVTAHHMGVCINTQNTWG